MTKVLVIEDEAFLIEEILTTLQFEGFEAIGANNGSQGVALAKTHLPDVIVCDIMMPEMVAVHGRVVPAGDIEHRGHVRGEHPTQGIGERHRLR